VLTGNCTKEMLIYWLLGRRHGPAMR